MKFENEDLKTTFEVQDKPTYREVLDYESRVELQGRGMADYVRLWSGVCSELVTSWESPHIDKPSTDLLDKPLEAQAHAVIKWAGLALFSYVMEIRALPKNS